MPQQGQSRESQRQIMRDAQGAYSDADDPFAVPDGKYTAFIKEWKMYTPESGGPSRIYMDFVIHESGEHDNKRVTASQSLDSDYMGYFKVFINSLGLDTEMMLESLLDEFDGLIGDYYQISVKNKDGYCNARPVKAMEGIDKQGETSPHPTADEYAGASDPRDNDDDIPF